MEDKSIKIDISSACNSECDQFIQQMPTAKLCHISAWGDMIQRTFGHKTFYLVAHDDNKIHGVLPLTQVRSKLFGNRLISQAFSDYGGPLARNPAISQRLCRSAVKIAREYNCDSLELRNTEMIPCNLRLRTDKISMLLPLISDPEEFWEMNLNHKIRNNIRKAQKSDLFSTHGGPELLDDFYRVWTIRMHQHGTPCYPRKLFNNIMETFPDKTRIFLVRLNDLTLAAGFVYSFRSCVQIRWAAHLIEYNRICPNALLFWAVIKDFCVTRARWVDLGRSTMGSSQHKFKKKWGAQSIPLYYQYWSHSGSEVQVVDPRSENYKKKVEMWKKLPLWLTRLAGPYISRNLA